MLSQRDVLIRIALLQRKMLIKTKNCPLKCLNWHSSTVRSRKMSCSVDGGRDICPLFLSPSPGIWQLKSLHPRECAIQGKKNDKARGLVRGGGRSELSWKWLLTDALILVLSQTQKGDFRTFPLPIFHHLGLNFPYNVPSVNHKLPKLSKLTVTRVECKLHSVTRASRYCVTCDFRSNNTLRSANTKYHYIFPSLHWYKTKEDLPLMNSCVFRSGVIGLVDYLAPFCDLGNSTLSTRRRFAARKLIQSRLFFRPEVNFHHRHNLVNVSSPSILRILLDMNIFSLHVPKHLLSANA